MNMKMCVCKCDPLHKILTQVFIHFHDYLIKESQGDRSNGHLLYNEASVLCPWCSPDLKVPSSLNFAKQVSQSALNGITLTCINLYKLISITNRTPTFHKKCLCLTFTTEYVTRIEKVWKDIHISNLQTIGESEAKGFSVLFQDSLNRLVEDGRENDGLPPLILEVEKQNFMNLQVILNRVNMTMQIIHWTLLNRKSMERRFNEPGMFTIGITELPPNLESNLPKLPLTLYRKTLTAIFIAKVLKRIGCSIDSDEFCKIPSKYSSHVFVVHENESEGDVKDGQDKTRIVVAKIGNVVTKDNSCRKWETIESFFIFRRRLKTLESKALDTPENEEDSPSKILLSNAALAQFTINFDLLSSNPVSQLNLDANENSKAMNDHESFLITYNYSRLVGILRKFKQKVTVGQYPAIPLIDTIDFARLDKGTEIGLIQMLLDWPRIIATTVDFLRQELNIDIVLKFIKELAYRFNAFYTQNAVLAQPSCSHEFQLMFTRVYLLRALQKVFEEFFEFIMIEIENEDDE